MYTAFVPSQDHAAHAAMRVMDHLAGQLSVCPTPTNVLAARYNAPKGRPTTQAARSVAQAARSATPAARSVTPVPRSVPPARPLSTTRKAQPTFSAPAPAPTPEHAPTPNGAVVTATGLTARLAPRHKVCLDRGIGFGAGECVSNRPDQSAG